jgi:histidinol dehydrogenase
MKTFDVKDPGFAAAYKKVVNRLNVSQASGTEEVVRKIIADVKKRGDAAVLRYTEQFDRLRVGPDEMRIGRPEIRRAYQKADPTIVESLRYAAQRITAFHQRQKKEGWVIEETPGVYLAQRVHPIDRVGLYVPGGSAAYPSSVLMTAIPARVAGVPRVVICSPTPKGEVNPYLLVAADIAGVDEIYRIGGAQAVAALAYGTETIPPVDKIVGPGNRYVAEAKRQVFGQVGIDMIAGPSELLLIADGSANPVYVASDLLSQAEHDTEAVVIFLATSKKLVEAVSLQMEAQMAHLPRKKIASAALKKWGVTFIVPSLGKAIEMANEIVPEHLSLFTARPFDYLDRIVHAGSVFLGEMTPQALGDYVAGPNHVLPTGGTARFSSPLSVDDFVKRSSVISYTQEALAEGGPHLIRIADAEGLTAHANMVRVRLPID